MNAGFKVILLFALVFICLFGCTQQPVTVYKPQKVETPVAVSCVSNIPPEPVWQVATLPPKSTHAAKVKAMAQDLNSARGYIGELEAILTACK